MRLDEINDLEDLRASEMPETNCPHPVPLVRTTGVLLWLLDGRHPLSGTDERSVTFFRTVAVSAALVARARQIAADVQGELAATFDGDSALLAAFVVSGYA